MSREGFLNFIPGLKAAADLSTHQYKAVKVTAANAVNIATAGADVAIGILQNKPVSGGVAEVAGPGSVCPAKAGAAVTLGARVMPDADGEVIDWISGTDANLAIGIALEAATAADEVIPILVTQSGASK